MTGTTGTTGEPVDPVDPGADARGHCDSCGRDDEPVARVQRVYLQVADWDREEKVDVVPEPEQWCLVCREHYPHQPI